MMSGIHVVTIVGALGALAVTAHAAPPACDPGDAEGCTSKCGRGDMDACAVLAAMYATGDGVEREADKAVELAKRSCDARSPRGCVALGLLSEIGVGVPKDEKRAFDVYQRACRDGYAYGCYRLASTYLAGHGVAVDPAKATELLRNACNADEQAACAQVAAATEQSDPSAAARVWEKACEAGHARSCASLGKLYEDGRGVAKNVMRARELYKRACERHLWSMCTYLGGMTASGGASKAAKKGHSAVSAVALFTAACDHFDLEGCNGLGALYLGGHGVTKDAAKAVTLFQRACAGNSTSGCANLGWAYTQGEGIAKDMKRGKNLLDRACADHNDWACERTKVAANSDADRCDALAGVEAGECVNQVGLAYQAGGSGIAKNTKRAAELFEQACGLTSPAGCTNFGSALFRGADVDRDVPRGLKLIKRACTTDKLVAACDYLKTLPKWAQGKALPDYALDGPIEHDSDGCKRIYAALLADKGAAEYVRGKTGAAAMVARFTRTPRPATISEQLWKACTRLEAQWYRDHGAEYDAQVAAEAEQEDQEREERRESERQRSDDTRRRMSCEVECGKMCRARSPGDECQSAIARCKRACQ
jgi:TPR repeat protein